MISNKWKLWILKLWFQLKPTIVFKYNWQLLIVFKYINSRHWIEFPLDDYYNFSDVLKS